MKPDDQRNKIILLAVLAVALVGYVAYTVVSSGKSTAQAVNKEATTRENTMIVDAEDPDAQSTMATGVFPEITSPTPRRDPFSISVAEYSASQAQNPSPAPEQGKARALPQIKNTAPNPFKSVNPFNISGMQMGEMAALPAIATQPAPPKARPVLTGVILGPQTLAIIDYENKSHVVEQGSSFAGKYRLVKVSKESVTLQEGSKQIRIGLGG